MLVHAGLSIIGRKGYELLMDQGIEKARRFAERIAAHPDFELMTAPELNILTYRYNPAWLQKSLAVADREKVRRINAQLDRIIETMQKRQRAAGFSFVSRTRLSSARYYGDPVIVFRVVLANPLTTDEILASVLEEQCALAQQEDIAAFFDELKKSEKL